MNRTEWLALHRALLDWRYACIYRYGLYRDDRLGDQFRRHKLYCGQVR